MIFNRKNKITGLGIATIVLVSTMAWVNPAAACSSEPLLGSMCVFAGNFAPRGYAMTQGQLLPISQNTALFSLLGTTYGGDGRTTFALPDTRGRSLIGYGHGPGLSNFLLGQKGGVETVTLSAAQMPSHIHAASTTVDAVATVNANSSGNTDNPSGNVWARKGRDNIYSDQAPDVTMNAGAVTVTASGTTTVNNTGGSQGHENRSPYIAMNWIIALQGIFPSRN